jgi:hypothetical protein
MDFKRLRDVRMLARVESAVDLRVAVAPEQARGGGLVDACGAEELVRLHDEVAFEGEHTPRKPTRPPSAPPSLYVTVNAMS